MIRSDSFFGTSHRHPGCPGLQFQIIPTYDEPGPAPWQLWAYGQRHAVSEETLQDAEKLFEDLITAPWMWVLEGV